MNTQVNIRNTVKKTVKVVGTFIIYRSEVINEIVCNSVHPAYYDACVKVINVGQ
jgi:hypothetical protein